MGFWIGVLCGAIIEHWEPSTSWTAAAAPWVVAMLLFVPSAHLARRVFNGD